MIKIKTFLLATLLLTGLVFPATAQIGEPRSNFSVGVNGGVNLNSASFTPTIKQNSLMGITGGLTARYISEKYFAMICGAQVELNISQRGWDELFEMEDENVLPCLDSLRQPFLIWEKWKSLSRRRLWPILRQAVVCRSMSR